MKDETRPVRRAVPAVSRAAAILRLLARSETPLGVNAIARELSLVPSTCLHILRVLADEDLVRVDPADKRYALGPGLLTLARRYLGADGFAARAQPLLDALSREHALTTIAVEVRGGEHMLVLALARHERVLALQVEVGSRFPALISATGRCYAAFGTLDPATLADRFAALNWDDAPDFESWKREVAEARRDGFAIDRGRYIAGVSILAVPVFDAARAMSHGLVAIGVGAEAARLDDPGLIASLREAADALSAGSGSAETR